MIVALLASRGLGVVRQSLFNALFGTGPEANAFIAAARFPDTLFNLIAGGALSHAFIPVFLSYEKEKGSAETWRLTSLVFNVILVALTLVTLIGELLAPAFVNTLLVPGYSPAEQALTTNLTRIMLLQPLILGLGTIATAILSSRRQFLLPALSLAVNNIGLIGGLLISLLIPGIGIYGVTVGVLVGAALQIVVQVPALWLQKVKYTFYWDLRHPGLREVMRLLIPNALTIGVIYAASIIETNFTSRLPDPASLAALHNADLLQSFPIALISQAIGGALLPYLSVYAASQRFLRMRQTALKVIGISIAVTIPIALILAFVALPVIRLLFQHGAFNAHSSDLTHLALLGYAVSLPGVIAGDMIVRGFIALKDTRTPLLTNIFNLLLRVGLIIVLLNILQGALLIMAIPLALAGAATAEALLLSTILLWRLNKKVRTDAGMQRLQRRRQYVKAQ